MEEQFSNEKGRYIVDHLVETIKQNKAYLSEIDGSIGDGDHGVNMAKGFSMAAELIAADMNLTDALRVLGRTLLMEIGGTMGPLYGAFFTALGQACGDEAQITAATFGRMLEASLNAVVELGQAKVGDKTLVDTLDPAVKAYSSSLSRGMSFTECLRRMEEAAAHGQQSTKSLVAKVGRASRLGERSRGVLDAGASSCFLILKSMAETMRTML